MAIVTCFFVSQAIPVCAYEALQGPTETRYWDMERAYNGYTLFGARGGTYLIDMEGRIVRTIPAEAEDLLRLIGATTWYGAT